MATEIRFIVPLERKTRPVLPTLDAAYHLNRAQDSVNASLAVS